ncbi:dihydrofolate reductase [Mycobacterium kyogaense]|uniref:dihydrofolate reductase n=1 Tax=Mycobacterium kyogaense TaxID=2212479 RepID=UPI000DAC48B2|nr:dihydrofolate reductase [Mycobacterium kyogaense]
MGLNLIWAQSSSGVIGRDNGIPWQVPEDMARFKELTMGQTVIMGRRTWESLPARFRPLPGRRNVVLTRHADYVADGAETCTELDGIALEDAWVIGGSEVYGLTLPRATRCEVTEIDIDLRREDDDALAPVLDERWAGTVGAWQDSASGLRYRFGTYLRA